MKFYKLALSGLFGLLLVSGCATNTKLTGTWSDPENKASYKNIMVVGVSNNEQKRRAYESFFVASFQDKGVASIASYTVIHNKEEVSLTGKKGAFRKVVESAIEGSDIDAVLVTHLVSIEEDEVYRPSLDYQPSYGGSYGGRYGGGAYYNRPYYGGMYGYHGYVTTYVQQPGYYTEEQTYVLESNLYDVASAELVWTTRSQTNAPESIQQAVKDISSLIISDLEERKLIH
jgi:hypothetical protein